MLHQVVFYCRNFLSWCPRHCQITIGRLQFCCIVRPSAMECLYIHQFLCSAQLPHATDVWWRQFGCTLLHDEELWNHPHHSHPQVFLLSMSDQPLWRHHPSLHQGSFERVADRFLGMKNGCMLIKRNNLIFVKLICTKLILIVFELSLQVKNKSFWLKINWMNTIFQEFWHGNIIFIKQKWKEQKWSFCVINCEPFYQCGCFVSAILLLNMLNSNRKRRKNTILCENILGKFIFHETKKKWTVSDVNS